jgi:predicted ATP-dependent endonuclease of OLD family
MFIDGIGISGYRSFGPEVQRLGPFKKINLIIGQNNSGKSNFLRFLKDHYPTFAQRKITQLEFLDKHVSSESINRHYEIAIKIDGKIYKQLMENLAQITGFQRIIDNINKILTSDILTRGTDSAWFPYVISDKGFVIDQKICRKFQDARIFNPSFWRDTCTTLTNTTGGDIIQHWIPDTLRRLSPLSLSTTAVSFIPAIREIIDGNGESDNELMSGKGLVKKLAKLEKPRYDTPELKEQFKAINHFLQTVTGDNTAIIEIPSEQNIIQVLMNGRTLPLSSLGTGIHEVIILASAATICQNQILCIEEPEIHLHPSLQKQLLNYLAKNTNNQYFIATHSAHLLDMPDVAIFHIRLKDGKSVVDLAITDSQKSKICDELGYKASDLLQTNYIIWVEGPSDRIYINHWIHSKDEDLIEGVHYSIMFYGGRLLSHLNADEEGDGDFIELRRLNRHMGIVIDSDKKNADDEINDTKKRVQEEFGKSSDFVWITQGKEIENYLQEELIRETIHDLYGKDVDTIKYSQYRNSIQFKKTGEKDYRTADKVKLASSITKKKTDMDVLGLNDKITSLIRHIRKSNGLNNPGG